MPEGNVNVRLAKAAREFNIGITTIVEFLSKKGHKIENSPNAKLSPDMYALLVKEFQAEKSVKESAKKIELEYLHHQQEKAAARKKPLPEPEEDDADVVFIKNAKSLEVPKAKPAPAPPPAVPEQPETDSGKEEAAPKPEEKFVKVDEAPVKETPAAIEQLQPEVPAQVPPVEIIHSEQPVQEKIPEPLAGETELPSTKESKPVTEDVIKEVEPPPPAEVVVGKREEGLKVLYKIDLDSINSKTKPPKKSRAEKERERKDKAAASRKPKARTPEKETTVTRPEGFDKKPSKDRPRERPADTPKDKPTPVRHEAPVKQEAKVVAQEPAKTFSKTEEVDPRFMPREKVKLSGLTIVGSIELPGTRKSEPKKPVASSSDQQLSNKKKKRKRIKKQPEQVKQAPAADVKTEKTEQQKRAKARNTRQEVQKVEPTDEDIQRQIRETMQRLSPSGKSKASKHRREKRQMVSQHKQEEFEKMQEDQKVLKVTEFVTANDLATMMNTPVTQIISTCFSLGLFVSINQRLDAETLSLLAEEFGYKVQFVSVEVQEAIEEAEEVENPGDIIERHPVVTVMGHVDHGKTSLLDYIRHTNVIAGEAGGITQHIGAYEVQLENGKKITFLDTPGHEAFTAMRARGTKVTDIAIIVVAADDNVQPQTVEAINHALAAGVPLVIAINKIDKANANVERVKEELSKLNILVEDWGGKYQSQEISAKFGKNIDELLEKVLLEAELLELKSNPKRRAKGSVIESALDKGRGYVAKILVQNGTLKIGDIVLAGTTHGRVKAMFNERNQVITSAGPSTPLLMLGLNGAPQAGDQFNVMADEKEAKSIALKRTQLQREQGLRTQKHITLDEIGRRIAIGDFKELNIIVKGDVDGSVEALSDSLLKLGMEQVQVNVIHKSVGQITESDVLLASASNAIIIGFQVRPSLGARRLAEAEQIDIRLYSIIYQALDEIKAAVVGMLSPEYEEKILSNIEVQQVFKIDKVGTIAGCMVLDGKIQRNAKIRLIRDGIVVFTGKINSLKRFKDDVKEVHVGQDCGIGIENFNDVKSGDIIEGYEMIEIKRKL